MDYFINERVIAISKIINLKDKKREILDNDFEHYLEIASTDLYNYIETKVRVSFSLLIVLDDANLNFLKTVNDEDLFVEKIAISAITIAKDTIFGNDVVKLSKVDAIVNDYLINKVFTRLEAWAEETLDIGWNDKL